MKPWNHSAGDHERDDFRDEPHDDVPFELSPADEHLLDELVANGFDLARLDLPLADRARGESMMTLFNALEQYPAEDADIALIHATLARIDQYEVDRDASRVVVADDEPQRMRWRLMRVPDLLSIAAILLIATSIALPMLSAFRHNAIESSCQANMRLLGRAFSLYADEYGNAMPSSPAIAGALSWDTARNFDNLSPLMAGGYCDERCLDCPGAAHDGPCYSYQLQVPSIRSTWNGARTVAALADRNPLIDAARLGDPKHALSLSLNHGERGQNVLHNDGSVQWLDIPKVRSDNIWLPDGILILQKGDVQHGPGDTFLTH
ncbi:MAG: hypothetical protein KDA25_08795 [Phycisphaerales bacterium]|nr:hypothetical protein [Phycisphaerales bacterium]